MANRGATVCRKAGCGRVIARSGYCETHKALACGWYETSDNNSSSRGYGAPWRKLRAQVLRRDNGLCQPCKKADRVTVARDVDHIVSRDNGGSDDTSNLQSICENCHNHKTLLDKNNKMHRNKAFKNNR